MGFIPTGLTQIESEGSSWYNALQTSLTKRYSNGFQFLASYTFSKSLDTDAANVIGVSENRANTGNQLDPRARYGRSSMDRTHRFIVNYMYDLKFFKNTREITNKLLDGWTIAGVTILQSGSPLTVSATNTNNAFGITNDRAQLASGCTANDVQASGPINSRLNGYFNKPCFTTFPIIGDDGIATAFGNSPPSLTNGPRQNNTDLVFTKKTKLLETVNMEFPSEFFNIFNHSEHIFYFGGTNMFKANIGARFPGTCEKAFNFYRSVFGGEFLDFIRIGDDPYTKANSPKEEHGKVAFVALQLGNVIFGADDAPSGDMSQLTPGNMLSISVQPDSRKEADRLFQGLAAGGKVTMEMTDYPWGYIGSIADDYGINWTVWYIPPRQG